MRRLDIGSAKWNAMAALAIAPCALANTIYTYTGNPFNQFIGTTYNASDFIQVTLTTVNPFPASMPLGAINNDLVSIQMTDGGNGPTIDLPVALLPILVSTDANDAISQWFIISDTLVNGIGTIWGTSNDPNSAQATSDLASTVDATGLVESGLNRNSPGVWSAATQVPEPAGYALALAGLAALALWRKVQGKAKVRPLG